MSNNDENFKQIKMKYLFEEDTGLIRQGLTMEKYARILMTENEDELNNVILNILEEEGYENIGDLTQEEE